jgi:hypothetical protein
MDPPARPFRVKPRLCCNEVQPGAALAMYAVAIGRGLFGQQASIFWSDPGNSLLKLSWYKRLPIPERNCVFRTRLALDSVTDG